MGSRFDVIEFRDVSVCYQPDERYPISALEKLNLKIERGEWIFLVGPSGAGKSTLLKLIYGNAHAMSGQVFVDDRDITRLPAREIPFLRRKMGVVFQDFLLMPQKTVWENVAFALQVIGAPQKSLVREVPRALETVGLQNKGKAHPHQLSGGEQQRVAIARAIVNHPQVLLADEPTGNLDPKTGADIIEVLERINATGTTIVMATHDREVVNQQRRRVVRLEGGHLSADNAGGTYHSNDAAPLDNAPIDNAPPVVAATTEPPRRVINKNRENRIMGDVLPATVKRVDTAPISTAHETPTEKTPIEATRSEETALDDAPMPPRARPVYPRRPIFSQRPPVSEESDNEAAPFSETKDNQAPLGSSDNPLVQFDRKNQPARRPDVRPNTPRESAPRDNQGER